MAIVIGDIHGNLNKAKAFLAFNPKALHIALGDYLDSFTEPPARQLEALQLLIESDAVLLWGNHDSTSSRYLRSYVQGSNVGEKNNTRRLLRRTKIDFSRPMW